MPDSPGTPPPPPAPPPPPPSVPSSPPPPGADDTAVVGRATVPTWIEDDNYDYDPGPERGPEIEPEPPLIDAEELAGLGPISGPPSRARRVMPLAEEASHLVLRYMFPTENYRGEWRRHTISLATPVSVAVVATAVLGLGGGFAQAYLSIPWLVPIVILLWLGIMAWVVWQIALWHYDRFILTNKRVMKISGIVTRKVAMMPLLRVTDMKYEQTPLGRILNYGTFVIESAGQDQALREVPYLPNPNELYLRVVEEMYDPGAVEARVDQVTEDEERNPGGDA